MYLQRYQSQEQIKRADPSQNMQLQRDFSPLKPKQEQIINKIQQRVDQLGQIEKRNNQKVKPISIISREGRTLSCVSLHSHLGPATALPGHDESQIVRNFRFFSILLINSLC